MSGEIPTKNTRFGFQWGPIDVYRAMFHRRAGFIVIIETPKQSLEVSISPKGYKITAGLVMRRYKAQGRVGTSIS